jgi:hypothetical protein
VGEIALFGQPLDFVNERNPPQFARFLGFFFFFFCSWQQTASVRKSLDVSIA